MRLIQSTREADIQNVEVPTWFVMESRGGEDWLRPSHPLHDEKELGDQDEVTYAIAARLPACALWNLLDCRDEDGVPLMAVVEWLRFIGGKRNLRMEVCYQGIYLKQVSRDLELATAMKGGRKQDGKPGWSFTDRLSMPMTTDVYQVTQRTPLTGYLRQL
jgi:hypothetical protein